MGLGADDLKMYGMAILVLIGVQWNIFNMITTMVQQRRSGSVPTVSIIISFISLGNTLLHLSTFAIVATLWAGILCGHDTPLFFCVILYVWLGSSSVSFWSIAWLSVLYCVKVVNFSSVLFGKIKSNISPIVNVALAVTLLNSCVMFAPFLSLHYRNGSYVTPVAENVTCTFKKLSFPGWIREDLYVLIFISYLAVLPVMVMLPNSLGLVVHLCKHTLSMRKNQNEFQSADSYLMVCRMTVALVGVYISTLSIIFFYFIHAVLVSDLQPDFLLLGYSFYCIASAVLLTISNKYLREKLCALICCEKPPG